MGHAAVRGNRHRLAGLAIALLVSSCGFLGDADDTATPTTTSTVPERRTLLRVAIDEWATCLNPVVCDTTPARHTVFAHVLPRLMETDADGAFVPSPLLTAAPAVSFDGLVVTYRLDPTAAWSDGRPITSTDVRVTWQAIMATPGADRTGYELIESVDDRDPHTAVVTFRRPYAEWDALFGGEGGWLLEADAIGPDLDVSGQFLAELPFSAGPFRLADWDPQSAVLVANDDYWDPDRIPLLGQVQLTNVDDAGPTAVADGVPVAAQRSGGVAAGIPSSVRVVERPDSTVFGLWFDQRSPRLREPAVRQALVTAVDRDALLRVTAIPGTAPALLQCAGWLPDLGPWCDPTDFPPGEASVDLASLVLAEAGWGRGGDGVLVRNGSRLSLPITHDATDARAAAVANAVATRLREVGIETTVQSLPIDVWRTRPLEGIDSGIGVYAVDVGLTPRVDDLYGCDAIGPEAAGGNPIAWCDTIADTAAQAFLDAATVDDRVRLAREVGDRVAQTLVWLPVRQGSSTLYAQADRVSVPAEAPLGDGPLGALHDFALATPGS